MDAEISPLDHIEFHIYPSQNRYEAWVQNADKKENVASGLLEHLLLHSAEARSLQSKGSNSKFILSPPKNSQNIKWFTKSTLLRFLHIIGVATIMDDTNLLKNEISQLEEARNFRISLYLKGSDDHFRSEGSGNSYSDGVDPDAEGSASKNELLQAMDSRLAALRGELIAAFDHAAGSRFSVEDMIDLEKFSDNFGSRDLSDRLQKQIELRQGPQTPENSSRQTFSETEKLGDPHGHTTRSSFTEMRVEYGASPAKSAQIERHQSSTDNEESSFSSEEERPSVERSRTLVRSSSPRRSASPMRRVQIGRSGSRRSTAITIKSLNVFPARERSFVSKELSENTSDEESEKALKKSGSTMKRMSVQDAIHLFESKQRDQTSDSQKARSLVSISAGASKSVLRRWSSGVIEDSSCPHDTLVDVNVKESRNTVESKKISDGSPEPDQLAVKDCPVESSSEAKLDSDEKRGYNPEGMVEESLPIESAGTGDKLVTSAEWSRQKEAELNELMTKMMESKTVKSGTVVPASSKREGSESLSSKHRGGSYDNDKEKSAGKLSGVSPRKVADKTKQVRTVKQVRDPKKVEVAPVITGDAGKKLIAKKLQRPKNSNTSPANAKSDILVTDNVKNASTKSTYLPMSRKSLPSPRVTEVLPAKVPGVTSSTGPTPIRRRSHPKPSVAQSSPKVETPVVRPKALKTDQNDNKKNSSSASAIVKQQPVSKPGKMAKSNVQKPSEKPSPTARTSLYSKVTKKGSIVPLESKPFLRKGSGMTPSVNSSVNKQASSDLQEPLGTSLDLTSADDSITVTSSTGLVILQEEAPDREFNMCASVESGNIAKSPEKCEHKENSGEVEPTADDCTINRMPEPAQKTEEESTISPTAWIEIDHEDTACDHIPQMVNSPANISLVRVTSPRVRHSLSQMLLEESNEHDVVDWGNAENSHPMVYHKDTPKGLKRLLKFTRKSKTDANSTGWSSPSIFSEEDDAEDPRLSNNRIGENLRGKPTLHSKNTGHQKVATGDRNPAPATKSKFSRQSFPQQLQDGHVTASLTTTKATRSFFSLSAFKSSK